MAAKTRFRLTTLFPFLSLPLEVRRKVYLVMRSWPSREHQTTLLVSKQIHAESQESYDQRALICSSAFEFVEEALEAAPVVLKNIQTLAIYFDDSTSLRSELFSRVMNLTTMFAADESLQSAANEYYFKDLQCLVSCLSRLPNITELFILRDKGGAVEPRTFYLQSLLAWLSNNYSLVGSLTLTVSNLSLGRISAFTNLQALNCFMYTLTPEDGMINLMEKLDSLEQLTLRRRHDCSGLTNSFTGNVFRSMWPLKSFSLLDDDKKEAEERESRDGGSQ